MAAWALGLAAVLAPQLLGGRPGWAIALLAAGFGAAAIFAGVTLRRRRDRGTPVGALGWVMVIAWGWTCLQALPLPRALVLALQPRTVESSDAAATLLAAAPRGWLPLSISPGGTQEEIVKGAALLSAFFAAWLLSRAGHRRLVLTGVGVSTVAMALVGLAHVAADAHSVFGALEPPHHRSPMLAPLVNANHLSGFLAMGAPLLVALGLDASGGRRLAFLSGGALVAACCILSVSRGGAAALVCGMLTLALVGVVRRRRARSGDLAASLSIAGATLALGLGLGLYVAAEKLYANFEGDDLSKLDLAAQGLALAIDHPFVGVGRGAFHQAFVGASGDAARPTHPENLIAQWSSEWGIPIATVLLGILVVAVLRALRSARSWPRFGAFAALTSLSAHEMVDYSSELLGVSAVAACLLGAMVAPRKSGRGQRGPPERLPGWIPTTASGSVALALAITVGPWLHGRGVNPLRWELEAHLVAGRREPFDDLLREAVALHPAEPVFVLLGGAEAAHHRDPRAVRFLNRAMALAPQWSAPHVEASRYLAGTGHVSQAYIEARAAEERRPGSASRLACSFVDQRPASVEALLRASGGEAGRGFLDRVADCLPLDAEAGSRIDRELLGHVDEAHVREAMRQIDAGRPGAALDLLAPVADHPRASIRIAHARALIAAERAPEAVAALEGAERWAERPEPVLRARADAQAAAGDEEAMRATTQRLRGRAAGNARSVADAWILEGRLEERLGNDGQAMAAYQRAQRLYPNGPALVRVARLAERLRDLGRAYRAYGEVCRRSPGSEACRARDRVRARGSEPSLPEPQREERAPGGP